MSKTLNFESIPDRLKELKQWLMWQYEQPPGGKKPTKIPYQVNGTQKAKSNDSSTWSDFQTCSEAFNAGKFDGIGFAFANGDKLAGIDLDHCYGADGRLQPWAEEIVEHFDGTYLEKSPSGEGLHIWCFGIPVQTGQKKWKNEGLGQGLEVYDHKSPRYFTITGAAISGREIIDCQSGLDWLYQQYWLEPHDEPEQVRNPHGQIDTELVRKALELIPAEDYATWIQIGMALKAGKMDVDIWHQWSKTSSNYVAGECDKRWASFNGTRIGLGTVFHIAKTHGFQFPKTKARPSAASLAEDEVPPSRPWPQLASSALYGIAGEVVRHVDERSEADPAAVLLTFLAMAGACFGPESHYTVGDTKHYPRLYVALVGQSSKARKGTSAGPCRKIIEQVGVAGGACLINDGPLSTGEGIIYAVRDPSDKLDKDGNPEDSGASDKRLLVLEGEFGAPLKAAQRDGNTLSAIMRSLYDHGNAAPLTKNNRVKTTGAHVGVVGHITGQELRELLRTSDIWNGFANRFLWGAVRRTKRMPFPQPMDSEFAASIAERLRATIAHARNCRRVTMTDEAASVWGQLYLQFEDRTGVLAAVTDRAEPHVLRLALIFTLLDCATTIDTKHLTAAVSVWEFCDESAKYIFGDSASDPNANKILLLLANGEKTRTALNDAFNGHLGSAEIRKILAGLQAAEKIQQRRSGGGKARGQPVTYWSLAPGVILPEDLSEIDELTPPSSS